MTFVHERVSEMNLYVSHGDKSKIEGRVADVLHRKIISMLIFIIIFNFPYLFSHHQYIHKAFWHEAKTAFPMLILFYIEIIAT